MEPIVVATDLSPASDSAVAYAANLANALGRPLHLLHAYTVPTSLTDLPVQPEVAALHTYPVSFETFRNSAEEGLQQQVRRLSGSHPGLPVFPQAIAAIGVSTALLDAVVPLQPLCLVLGTHPRHGFADNLDSNGLELLRRAHFPLLSVPGGFSGAAPRSAALAVDRQELAPAQLAAVRHLVTTLGLELHIVHVQTSDTDQASGEEVLRQLSGITAHGHTVRHQDVTAGLQEFVQRTGIQLLLTLPHHHNFFERLFGKQHTSHIVSEVSVPVLVIPE